MGPWRDWRLYLPVVHRVLEADWVVFKHAGGDRATIEVERSENGWRVKPVNVTFPYTSREQLEKILALLLHPNKWRFALELKINTTAQQQ